MEAYINTTIPVKNIVDFAGPISVIEEDEGITASGALRSDTAKVREQWRLTCRKVNEDDWRAIYNYLYGIMFTETTFWCEDFGGTAETNSKFVKVVWGDPKLEAFGRGTWQKSGRTFSLTVTETR